MVDAELPEVETVRRGLEPAMVGARFTRVLLRRPDLRFPFPDHFAERLRAAGHGARARAKYLLADLVAIHQLPATVFFFGFSSYCRCRK